MSGFVGLVRFDDGSIDDRLFQQLRSRIGYRGPHGLGEWITPQSAFAHTLLINGPEAPRERQPLVKGSVVVVADSRIDDRARLAHTLGLSNQATDSELIGAAYEMWGDASADHIIGDFSFAIWDADRRRLFCARDRFGLRAFFYGYVGGCLVFSNDLHALLGVPELSTRLNEDAIADFLMFGGNQDPLRTTFAGIYRLPAAHTMSVRTERIEQRRYWSVPARENPVPVGEQEAVGRFREIFLDAVGDRVRAGRAVISMSGGLDSTSVAATAREWVQRNDTPVHLVAMTSIAHDIRPDDEQPFAELTARALGLEMVFDPSTNEIPFDRWTDERHRGLEPGDDPFNAATVRFFRTAASQATTILTGHGGDAAFYTSHGYFYDLLREWRWARFLNEAIGYAVTRRRRPPLCLRSRFRRALGFVKDPSFPPWIDDEFARRTNARERWQRRLDLASAPAHPFRPEASRLITDVMWTNLFEGYDAAATGCAVEHSTPYFDTRVIEYLFTLPPMPHFADKDLLRRSMRGWLPDPVRLRPKTPFAADQFAARTRDVMAASLGIVSRGSCADGFVKRTILSKEIAANGGRSARHQQTIATSLTGWLIARG